MADWLKGHLREVTGGRVRDLVPSVYDAYVRVPHPVHDASGSRIRWTDLAEVAGLGARPDLRWEELVEAFDAGGRNLEVVPPEPGCLDPDSMQKLVRSVDSMAVVGQCVAGVWDGWGWSGEARDGGLIGPRCPNILLPADRSWFLSSEIDLDSSILGGRRDLCEAVLATSEIEAWPIGLDGCLSMPG